MLRVDESFSDQQNKIQSEVKKMRLKEQAEILKKTVCPNKKAESQEKFEETFVEPSTSYIINKRKTQKDVQNDNQLCTSDVTTVQTRGKEPEDNSIDTGTMHDAVDEPVSDNFIDRPTTPTAADEPEVDNSTGTSTQEPQFNNPATVDRYLLDDQRIIYSEATMMELNLPVLGGQVYESKSDFEAVVLHKLTEMTTRLTICPGR